MKLTFKKGGVHPAENKTASREIELLPLPMTAYVPVKQHIGAPASVLVSRGEKVVRGQIIAKANGFVSANIHAPISGSVTSVDNIAQTDGKSVLTVVIKADAAEHDTDTKAREDYWSRVKGTYYDEEALDIVNSSRISEIVTQAGIVGLGGATFPTHVKLSYKKDHFPDTLIINGCECEPYLTCDDALMRSYAEYVAAGSALLGRGMRVEKVIVAIEDNKPEAFEAMKSAAKRYKNMEVVQVKTKYPQGGEKQLIAAITKRYVPSGALPASVGVVVDNVATAFAVWQAVAAEMPLIERVVTVTGDIPQEERRNYIVALGTPLSELPFTMPEHPKAILGGPMMGRCASNIDAPTTKGTSGLLLLNQVKEPEIQPCIRCGACYEACPMGLEPSLLAAYGKMHLWDDARQAGVFDCLECGSCNFSCPSNRPILDYIRIAKKRSRK